MLRTLVCIATIAAGASDAMARDQCPTKVDQSAGTSWWTVDSGAGIAIAVDKSQPGCFILSLPGGAPPTASTGGNPITLVSAGVTLRVAGLNMSSLDGTLVPVNTRESTGRDATGSYTSLRVDWVVKSSTTATTAAAAASAPDTTGTAIIWSTVYKMYNTKTAAVVFQQIFHRELESCSTGGGDSGGACTWGMPASGFPTFNGTVGSVPTLGIASFHNQGDPQTSSAGFAGLVPDEMGFVGGMPLIIINPADARTLVLSPVNSFLSTSYTVNDGDLICGVEGAVANIPANHTTETIAFFGGDSVGITETVMAWGDVLLGRHGKQRTPHDINDQVSKLGYSTVGHYFYGLVQDKNAEETMRAVKDDAEKEKLPFGWYLLDSWWYGERATPLPNTYGNNSHASSPGYSGTWRWDDEVAKTRDGGFPSGLKNLTKYLGTKIAMHMGLWVGSNTTTAGAPPYATDPKYPGQSGWVVEGAGSLPLGDDGGAAFWDYLFKQAADWGLGVVKLDHVQTQVPDMRVTQTEIGTVETWLTNMGNAASKHGIWKQYGGCVANMVLHSVTLKNAVTARVGDDYIPSWGSKTSCESGPPVNAVDDAFDTAFDAADVAAAPRRNVKSDNVSNVSAPAEAPASSAWLGGPSATIGRNTLVWWAVGVRPYKDATFTGKQDWAKTTCFQHAEAGMSVLPGWWGLQDSAPSLGLLVSAMSAGPIAACDGVGDFNRELLMRASRSDGITLKPSRPAVALDAVWVGDVFGSTPAATTRRGIVVPSKGGEVTFTYTDLTISTGGAGGSAGAAESRTQTTARWFFVLGWGSVQTLGRGKLTDGANVTFADITPSSMALDGDYYAWSEVQPQSSTGSGTGTNAKDEMVTVAATVIPFGPKHPTSTLAIQNMGGKPGNYVLWRVAPVLPSCGGLVVLGETSKFISASITRIAGITCDGRGAGKVALVGGAGESVTISFATQTAARAKARSREVEGVEEVEAGLVVHSATCTINAGGTATLSLPSGTCT